MIKMFVGLGNPGPEYEATRHNAGFWWLDELARELKVSFQPEKSYYGFAARFMADGQPRWLLQPQTFMNRSGQSVAALARFFKIQPNEILVAHDELDVLPGQAKLKLGGSHAGHNGLRDIHTQLGSPDYWRLRIGIGHPGSREEVVNWVLKKPSKEDREGIEDSLGKSNQSLAAADGGRDGKGHCVDPHPQASSTQASSAGSTQLTAVEKQTQESAMRAMPVIWIYLSALAPQLTMADTVYKCQVGDKTVYSQTPCAGANTAAKTLDLNDTRSPEQREQSQAAVQAQMSAADALESKRIATEEKEAKKLADQQAAAAKAARTAKAPEPVVVHPIIVVRPTQRAVNPTPPTAPPKPYCNLSALRCN